MYYLEGGPRTPYAEEENFTHISKIIKKKRRGNILDRRRYKRLLVYYRGNSSFTFTQPGEMRK